MEPDLVTQSERLIAIALDGVIYLVPKDTLTVNMANIQESIDRNKRYLDEAKITQEMFDNFMGFIAVIVEVTRVDH